MNPKAALLFLSSMLPIACTPANPGPDTAAGAHADTPGAAADSVSLSWQLTPEDDGPLKTTIQIVASGQENPISLGVVDGRCKVGSASTFPGLGDVEVVQSMLTCEKAQFAIVRAITEIRFVKLDSMGRSDLPGLLTIPEKAPITIVLQAQPALVMRDAGNMTKSVDLIVTGAVAARVPHTPMEADCTTVDDEFDWPAPGQEPASLVRCEAGGVVERLGLFVTPNALVYRSSTSGADGKATIMDLRSVNIPAGITICDPSEEEGCQAVTQ
jgi:hypothetical protein